MEQTLLLSKIFTQGGKTVVSVVDQHTILAQSRRNTVAVVFSSASDNTVCVHIHFLLIVDSTTECAASSKNVENAK